MYSVIGGNKVVFDNHSKEYDCEELALPSYRDGLVGNRDVLVYNNKCYRIWGDNTEDRDNVISAFYARFYENFCTDYFEGFIIDGDEQIIGYIVKRGQPLDMVWNMYRQEIYSPFKTGVATELDFNNFKNSWYDFYKSLIESIQSSSHFYQYLNPEKLVMVDNKIFVSHLEEVFDINNNTAKALIDNVNYRKIVDGLFNNVSFDDVGKNITLSTYYGVGVGVDFI